MRTNISLLLITIAALAEDVPITRPAGASFKIADLEKARQFYTGILGLEEAFDLKDSSGALQSVFFKVNDDQYLEFAPGAADNFHLEHVSILTADLKKMRTILETCWLAPGKPAQSADGNTYLAIKDPDQIEIRFVRYMPGSQPGVSAIISSISAWPPTTRLLPWRFTATSSTSASCSAEVPRPARSGGSIWRRPVRLATFWS